MSEGTYTIKVRVIQSDVFNWFSIVEKTVFADGYWTECDGEHKLTMTRSGTSGILRFRNKEPNGSFFQVALGVHNFKRWCDIVDNSEKAETAVMVHPTYYPDKDGNHDYPGNRWDVLWKQRDNFEMTLDSSGCTVTVDYYVNDGFDLCATITIIDNGGDNDDE